MQNVTNLICLPECINSTDDQQHKKTAFLPSKKYIEYVNMGLSYHRWNPKVYVVFQMS